MRLLQKLVAGVLLACSLVGIAAAQADYPNKPIRFIVSYPPGGSTDVTARVMGQWLSQRLGQRWWSRTAAAAATTSAPRPRCARRRRLHHLPGQPGQRHQRHAVQQPVVQLPERHGAGGRHHPRAQRDDRDQELPGQDGRRVHRVRQEEPGQGEHGVVGLGHLGAPVGRDVQGHGRHRHEAHPLQGRRPGHHRPHRRPGRRHLRQHAVDHHAHPRRHRARAGRHHHAALARAAGHPGDLGSGARLRGQRLVRHRGAQGHAGRRHRAPEPRGERRAGRSRHEGQAGRPGRRAHPRHARAVLGDAPHGDREVGQDRPVLGREGGIWPARATRG
jgi:hypothetical protein